MKHTPGPWIVSLWENEIFVRALDDENECADICTMTDDEEDMQANARLIAAAPELLEALQLADRVLRDRDLDEYLAGEYQIIEDAIAKAQG